MKAAGAAAAMFGGNMKDGQDAVKALVEETGVLSDINLENSAALGKFVANTGLAGNETAKLLKTMKLVTGESVATNLNTLLAADNLAESEGVLSSKVFSDLASNTELFARAGKQGAEQLKKAAVHAAKIGTELSVLDGLADNLLDIQKTMEAQMTIQTLTGANVDLTRAVALANQNDLTGLAQEFQNQFAGINIAQLDRFTQNQIKDSLGLSLEQFNALSRGETPSEAITPPVAKDQLQAQNSTNEILTRQASDIKLLREQNAELLTKLNGSIKSLGR